MNTALITLGILIALVLGFFAGRWHGMSKRSKQLSEELEQKEEELSALKSNVNEHFSETARLFTNLTEEYKSLYQHLAQGASKLSNESFKLTLGAPSAENITQDTNDKSENSVKQEDITDISEDEMVSEALVQPVDYARPDNLDDSEQTDQAETDVRANIKVDTKADEPKDSASDQAALDNEESQNENSKPVAS